MFGHKLVNRVMVGQKLHLRNKLELFMVLK